MLGNYAYADGYVERKKEARTAEILKYARVEKRSAEETRNHEADNGITTDSISAYFSNVKRFSLLTAEEEHDLAVKVGRGDLTARKRMIEGNLRLVISIAKKYVNRGLPLQDLIEEGNIGLIKSVERFKATKGCRFSTYATYWIRQSIDRAIANQAETVRLPIHVTNDIARVSRASRELTASLKREPTFQEISGKTGLSGRYVKKLSTVSNKTYSLESTVNDDSDSTLLERLEDTNGKSPMDLIAAAVRSEKIREWLKTLDTGERMIIKMRFGFDGKEPRTLETVGKIFGVTRERIRQIEIKALGKLRKMIESEEMDFSDVI